MKKDNCKNCVSKCEHAGKDREFVCIGGKSCKVMKSEFDISKVKIVWDFSPNDIPLILFVYVDGDKTYLIGKSDTDEGVVDCKKLEQMWREVTDPEAVRTYQEKIKKWRMAVLEE